MPVTLEELEGAVGRQVGFRLDRTMRLRLDRSARDLARGCGLTLEQYADLVRRDDGVRQALVERLVVPTTAFFRHPEQFAALATLVTRWPEPVVVWSAACSVGAEPYSLAMLLAESRIGRWRVVATDVSAQALARAAAGEYEERELAGLSPERHARFLEPVRHGWRVVPELREMVTFAAHNLIDEEVPRAARGAAAVFCRNVMIYFRPEVQRAALDRIASQVPGLQALFLGATESVIGLTDRYVPESVDGAYVYRPRPAGAPPAARRQAPAPPPRPAPEVRHVPVPAPPAIRHHEHDSGAYMTQGRAAMERGDPPAAIAAFRKAAFLDPDSPLAHLGLGLALEAAGDDGAARAFAAALAALGRRDHDHLEGALEGFSPVELVRMLSGRLGHPR